MTTTEVENFPGFPDGVMGPDLMDNMRKQAERFGAEFITDDVTRVDLAGDVKTVYVGETDYSRQRGDPGDRFGLASAGRARRAGAARPRRVLLRDL